MNEQRRIFLGLIASLPIAAPSWNSNSSGSDFPELTPPCVSGVSMDGNRYDGVVTTASGWRFIFHDVAWESIKTLLHRNGWDLFARKRDGIARFYSERRKSPGWRFIPLREWGPCFGQFWNSIRDRVPNVGVPCEVIVGSHIHKARRIITGDESLFVSPDNFRVWCVSEWRYDLSGLRNASRDDIEKGKHIVSEFVRQRITSS